MNICVFTGTRADYGLLRPVMRKLEAAPDAELHILVSGTHLSPDHGMTVQEIQSDGFISMTQVEIDLSDDSRVGVCKSTGQAVERIGLRLRELRPDILVLLGDRYEALACAIAASLMAIPLAHIHGGEVTEGAVDEFFRHSITKMSHLHFTATEPYRKRVIQLGEAPDRVFNVGSLGIENIKNIELLSSKELGTQLNFALDRPYFLATLHPATLEGDTVENQCREQLEAIKTTGLAVVFTKANADSGGRIINEILDEFCRTDANKYYCTASLGLTRYLSAMSNCSAVVGNSSSGIIEAPSFGVPTVNIGNRQLGRTCAKSVIHAEPNRESIKEALRQSLSPDFKALAKKVQNPYEKPNTSTVIVDHLKSWKPMLQKKFYDIPAEKI